MNTFYNLIFLKSNQKVISQIKKRIKRNLFSIKNINLSLLNLLMLKTTQVFGNLYFLKKQKQTLLKVYKRRYFFRIEKIQKNFPTYECFFKKATQGQFDQFELSITGPNDSIHGRDLVLITTQEYNNQQNLPHLLALVDSADEIFKVYTKFSQINKESENSKAIIERIKNKEPFYIRKITGLSSLEREYKALHLIDTLFLKNVIFSAENMTQTNQYFEIQEKLDQRLKQKYNQSQYEAIRQTLKTSGITLIQGPPGTGKTKTVIGTVSVLLSSYQIDHRELLRKQSSMEIEEQKPYVDPWLQPDYDDWRDHIFDDVQEDLKNFFNFKQYEKDVCINMIKNEDKFSRTPDKVLVCGPSNASVDEIIKKVLDEGLLDENGIEKQQMIVRIGENYDPTLYHISLEGIVKQRMFEQKLNDSEIGKVRKDIITQAKVVFGTLSSAGSNILLLSDQKFDTVIIDEAAQAVEVSTLIPLQYGCKRLILIGDHNQLPATVFSKVCEKFKYDQSLFERLEKQGYPIHMLKTQYRMHPNISKFISTTFYNSELNDAENLMQLVGNPQFYKYYTYSPVVVLHVRGYEQFVRNSYQNILEAQIVSLLYSDLIKKFPLLDPKTVGIVSPYSQQISQIQSQIRASLGMKDIPVEVKTVDGFQGREKDLIIFSTVKSSFIDEKTKNPKKGIGFLKDPRRMNVSLSRCRQSLIIVADIYKIYGNKLWHTLVDYALELGQVYRVDTKDPVRWFEEFDQNPLKYQILTLNKY